MSEKKRSMLKIRPEICGLFGPSAFLWGSLALEALVGWCLLEFSRWLAFVVGLFVFGIVFGCLEALTRLILAKGSLRGGVVGGFFWFLLKFLGPIILFFYSVDRGLPFIFVFVGLLTGLLTAGVVLKFLSSFSVENY